MLVVASGAFSLFSRAAISSGVGTGLFVMKCVTDAEKKSSTRWVIRLVAKLYVRTMGIRHLLRLVAARDLTELFSQEDRWSQSRI